jgi:tetratricopeptide (TPR) repeat protein
MSSQRPAKSRSRLIVIVASSLALLSLAAVGGWLGLRWHRQSDLAATRVRAFALFDEGKFEEALGPLSRVVGRDREKKDVEALRRLAKARLLVPAENNGHIPQAMKFYMAAIAADPTDVESHRELLQLHFGTRQLPEAERVANALLKLDPSDPIATQLLAQILITKDDREGARQLLTKRVTEHPEDIEAKVQLWRLWTRGAASPEECLAEVDGWLAMPDPDPVLRVIRAERLRAAGRGSESRAEIELILEMQPKSLTSCRVVANTFQRIGRKDAARRVLAEGERLLGERDGSPLALDLFRMGWLSDDLDAAAEGVEIGASDPTARWVGRSAITLAFLRGDPVVLDTAIADFTPSGAKATADSDFESALQPVLEAIKDPSAMPKANAAIERALTSNPKDPVLLYAQGQLRLAAGDRGSAIASISEAFDATNGAWVRAGLFLVPALEAYGDRTRAKAILAKLEESQSGHPGVQTMLVYASADAVARGEPPVIPEKEFANLARSLDRESETNPALAPLAVLSLATGGRENRARAVVDRVLADPNSRGELLLEVARIVRQAKVGDEALLESLLTAALERGAPPVQVEAFRASRDGGEKSLPALIALADGGDLNALRAAASLADQGSPEQAVPLLERILKDDASVEGISLVLNSQTVSARPELLEQAIAAAERIEGGRGDTTAVPRARLLLAKGKPSRAEIDAALAELDEVRQRRGETAELLAMMASLLLASDPPDITAASRLAGKAATLAPDRGQLQLLATALFRQAGNNDSAILYLQKAMASPSAKSDPAVRRGIIEELRVSGQLKPAADEARRLAADTNTSFDWMTAANLSELAEDRAEIERCLRAAVAAPDALPVAWSRLANGLGRAGRLTDARATLESLRSSKPESMWLPIEVEFELNFGKPEDSIAQLDAAIAKYPDDPSLMLFKARERIAKQDPAAALEIAKRATALEANRPVAREIALQLVGYPDPIGAAAIDALAAAGGIAADPIRQLRAMRDGAEAASASRALELARRVPNLWTTWAFALDVAAVAGDPVNRLMIAEEAVRVLPNDPRALAACCSLLLEQARPGEARDLAERLRIISATTPEYRSQAIRLAALGHLGTGQVARAKEILLAAGKETGDADSLMLASVIDAQLGNVAEAYRRAAPTVEKSDPALMYWMRTVGSLSPKDAMAMLEAVAAHESRMPNYFASAWIIASGRDNPAGLERAARLIEVARAAGKPPIETAAVAFELAVARDDRAAIETARAALLAELDPAAREIIAGKAPAKPVTDASGLAAADAATTEAKALLDRGRDLERAQKLLEAAIAAQGTPDQRVALARVLAARGQGEAALEIANRVTKLNPGLPDAWLALARAKLAQRDREGALIAVEEGRKALTTAFFVSPKVKSELDAMAGAIAALSNRG